MLSGVSDVRVSRSRAACAGGRRSQAVRCLSYEGIVEVGNTPAGCR